MDVYAAEHRNGTTLYAGSVFRAQIDKYFTVRFPFHDLCQTASPLCQTAIHLSW